MAEFTMDQLKSALEKVNETVSEPLVGVDYSGWGLKFNADTDEVTKLVEAIKKCEKLEFLNLSGNSVSVEAATALGQALNTRPELKHALWSDIFTGRMKTEIPKALSAIGAGMIQAGTQLCVLDLCDNAFGPIGVRGLAELLSSPVCEKLEVLRLNNNGLGIEGVGILVKALERPPPNLKTLVMGRNRLENPGAIALAGVLKRLNNLEELSIPQNGIYHEGVKALAEGLALQPRLRTLNFNDNTVGRRGARFLGRILPHVPMLQNLNLGDCLLKTKGARRLLAAMKNNVPELQVLDIRFNEICKDAAFMVQSELVTRPDLTARLGGNWLGAAGKKAIVTASGARANFATREDGAPPDSDEEDDQDDQDDEEDESGEDSSADEVEEVSDDEGNEESESEISKAIKVFLADPSQAAFTALGPEPVKALLDHFKNEDVVEYSNKCMMAVCCVSSVREEAAARELYRGLAAWAVKHPVRQHSLTNAILEYLGVMKSETKPKVVWDVKNCAEVLAGCIAETWFPAGVRDTLRYLLLLKITDQPDSPFWKHPQLYSDRTTA